jgi:hypothetical protein
MSDIEITDSPPPSTSLAPTTNVPLAPQNDGSGVTAVAAHEAPAPAPITEQEVGEYREQDRYLPVRAASLLFSSPCGISSRSR